MPPTEELQPFYTNNLKARGERYMGASGGRKGRENVEIIISKRKTTRLRPAAAALYNSVVKRRRYKRQSQVRIHTKVRGTYGLQDHGGLSMARVLQK